jgi:hypothetical protein
MNIQQLSANINSKLAQLEQQISKLEQQLASAEGNKDQITKDLLLLKQLKAKLKKSYDIALRAHELQRGSDEKLLQRKRWLGIGLCIISGLGLLAIAAVILMR